MPCTNANKATKSNSQAAAPQASLRTTWSSVRGRAAHASPAVANLEAENARLRAELANAHAECTKDAEGQGDKSESQDSPPGLPEVRGRGVDPCDEEMDRQDMMSDNEQMSDPEALSSQDKSRSEDEDDCIENNSNSTWPDGDTQILSYWEDNDSVKHPCINPPPSGMRHGRGFHANVDLLHYKDKKYDCLLLDTTRNYPELKQYHNGWLANQLINQALTNSRNQAKKMIKNGGIAPLAINNNFAPEIPQLQTQDHNTSRRAPGTSGGRRQRRQ